MLSSFLLLALASTPSAEPLHVFLRGGPKTHGPEQHEHARFVDEWKKLLSARGAAVEGALRFPDADELGRADVLVIYAAEGASIHGDERTRLDAFRARGGGLVVLHDGVCGDDPEWFATVAGGAWKHGKAKYLEGPTDVHVTDHTHPITKGIASFRFQDEIYFDLELDPEAQVLARGFHSVFDASPQAWVLERGGSRSFVSIQGHEWTSFSHPAWRSMVLRGIAWAGKRDVDLLVSPEEKAQLAYPPGGPLRPDRAHEALVVHPDFELSLVAAEPLIEKPISIDWDARGRMWLALTPGYPEKAKFSGIPAHDEVVVLEDQDHDGRMDARTVFAGGLDLVTSLVLHRDGAIVTAAPDILFLRDTDGDGAADKKEVLFTGFGFADTHAVISNMRWGIDGWIYATQGYSGNASRHVTNKAGHDFGHIGNGLLRFKPDGSAIEMVSSYGSNTWGLDFSEEGELFFSMANGAHLRHVVVPEGVLAEARLEKVESWNDLPDHDRVVPLLVHKDPAYVQIDFVGGFTAASGCTLYTGGAWPDRWRDTSFVCEPTVHLVHHDVIAPKGPSFTATKDREAEFLAGTDPWFRPVLTRVGPDGALYVLDFYNLAVVHNDTRGPKHGPTNAALRPDRDHEHGRVWRVQHKSAHAAATVDLSKLDNLARAKLLGHENRWQRITAQRLLVERGESAKLALITATAGTPLAKVHAVWALEQLGPLGADVVATLLADSDARVRHTALGIAARSASARASKEILPTLLAYARSDDARTRLLALLALGAREPESAVASQLVETWPKLEDDWSRSVALRLALRQDGQLWQVLASGTVPDECAGLVTEVARRNLRTKDAAPRATIMIQFAAAAGARSPDLVRGLLDAIAASDVVPQPELVAPSLGALLASLDIGLALPALRIAARLPEGNQPKPEIQRVVAWLERSLADETRPDAERLLGMKALLALPDHRTQAIAAGASLLEPGRPIETQLAAIETLGACDDPAAARALARAFPSASPTAQTQLFEKLASRASSAATLLDLVEAGELKAGALGPQRVHRLRTFADPAIAARAEKLLGSGMASSAAVDALVAKLLPEVDRPGDATKGKEVFTANCATCHTAYGTGGKVGPDLSGMGTHGARDLLPIVLDPSRTVEAAYVEWIAETKDGEIVPGVLARESADSILLRSSAGERELARSDIASLRSTGRSPMPAGFESLGAPALRDLFAYLSSGHEGFRVLDLSRVATANGGKGLYDPRDPNHLEFARRGIQDVLGIPFELLDPARSVSGCDAVVLKGGLQPQWNSKLKMPQRVEVQVGCPVERVHVLGGIAAWGFPYFKEPEPILSWTWKYADGTSEEVVFKNGVEFADWIGRYDVPGSRFVEGVVADDSAGQVRYHTLAPSKPRERIESIVLASYDNHFAPTVLAITAELAGAAPRVQPAPEKIDSAKVVLLGGGSSHDFERWFDREDKEILVGLAGIAKADIVYTASTARMAERLAKTKVLVLSTNQPIAEEDRRAVVDFVARGGGLLLLHPGTWRNWDGWQEQLDFALGGSPSHEAIAAFDVELAKPEEALSAGVPKRFAIEDELYRIPPPPEGATVIARGKSRSSGAVHPVMWTLARGAGKVVGLTLGHDGRAHELPAFRTILANAVRHLLQP